MILDFVIFQRQISHTRRDFNYFEGQNLQFVFGDRDYTVRPLQATGCSSSFGQQIKWRKSPGQHGSGLKGHAPNQLMNSRPYYSEYKCFVAAVLAILARGSLIGWSCHKSSWVCNGL